MRTSEERVKELHRRMQVRRQDRLRRRFYLIAVSSGAVSLAAALIFAVGLSRLSVEVPQQTIIGAAGSIFADHRALGYVVVALMAFCLGAAVTVLCHRLQRRMTEEHGDDREP